MKKLHFSEEIRAPRSRVWQTMLAPGTYRDWTAPFGEGSHYEGSWNQGDRIRFLGPNGSGMTAVIAERREPEFLSIKHVGEVADGIEDTNSERVRAWAPAFENYTFNAKDGGTEVGVDLDVTPEWEPYMRDTWPKALAKLKTLCETH